MILNDENNYKRFIITHKSQKSVNVLYEKNEIVEKTNK